MSTVRRLRRQRDVLLYELSRAPQYLISTVLVSLEKVEVRLAMLGAEPLTTSRTECVQ